MVEVLPPSWLLVGCERAADLRQHLGWGDRAGPPVGVGHQVFKALTLVGVGDRAARSWATSGAARRPSASSKSSHPSRQSTSPKPHCL